jgi:hypothetical protein
MKVLRSQDNSEMNAMNRGQTRQSATAPLAISAIWWALIFHAALSALVR